MPRFISLGAIFFLGIALGAGGFWLAGREETPPAAPASTVPAGWQEITLPWDKGYGIKLQIRLTDRVSRLAHEGQVIGFRIADSLAPEGSPGVDLVTVRLDEFYDLPEATALAPYKENREGFTVNQAKEAVIGGYPAVKQLYTAVLGTKRGDGAVLKRPNANLMRYVVEGPAGHILLLKSNASFQRYLDTVALSVQFVPASLVGDASSIDLEGELNSDGQVLPAGSGTDLFNDSSEAITLPE